MSCEFACRCLNVRIRVPLGGDHQTPQEVVPLECLLQADKRPAPAKLGQLAGVAGGDCDLAEFYKDPFFACESQSEWGSEDVLSGCRLFRWDRALHGGPVEGRTLPSLVQTRAVPPLTPVWEVVRCRLCDMDLWAKPNPPPKDYGDSEQLLISVKLLVRYAFELYCRSV